MPIFVFSCAHTTLWTSVKGDFEFLSSMDWDCRMRRLWDVQFFFPPLPRDNRLRIRMSEGFLLVWNDRVIRLQKRTYINIPSREFSATCLVFTITLPAPAVPFCIKLQKILRDKLNIESRIVMVIKLTRVVSAFCFKMKTNSSARDNV